MIRHSPAATAVKGGYLAAADIGTTTIAMVLYEGTGNAVASYLNVNPQLRYGADVLSRIQAAREPEAANAMQEEVRGSLWEGLRRFRAAAGDRPLFLSVAANTTMSYLLMGWDTEELSGAPFLAKHLDTVFFSMAPPSASPRGSRWDTVPSVLLPGVSAFVGADVLAGIFACGMQEKEERTLLLDLGTNGEMVLGNREKMLAASTAAGPAFEGGAAAGTWGADLVSLTAELLDRGIVDETGLLAEKWFGTGIRIGDVLVTQGSIRQLQLAKGAVRAGIAILLKHYGLSGYGQVDRVVLAGGLGSYLNPEAAARIGLLPQELADKALPGGNTALAGAYSYGRRLFLETPESLSRDPAETKTLEAIRENISVLNLAQLPEFEKIYLASMDFPG
jgi:uncharacterized 2Fe-2S/4Fe-4S cluster protein (DUF4445 family)